MRCVSDIPTDNFEGSRGLRGNGVGVVYPGLNTEQSRAGGMEGRGMVAPVGVKMMGLKNNTGSG